MLDEQPDPTDAEIDLERIRHALEEIATMTGSQAPALNMSEVDWYRRLFYDCVGIAAGALRPINPR